MNEGKQKCADFARNVFEGNTYNNMLVESSRGCIADIFDHPVEIEPFYEQFNPANIYKKGDTVQLEVEYKDIPSSWYVYKLKVHLEDKILLDKFDFLLSNFSGIHHIISFEIIGNQNNIDILIGAPLKSLLDILANTWQSVFPGIVIVDIDDPFKILKSSFKLNLFDIYPEAPYYREIGSSNNNSQLINFLKILSNLEPNEIGFSQVLLCPVKHDWHYNIKALLSAENVLGPRAPYGKTPSSMVKNITKSLFAVRTRFGCITSKNSLIESLKIFCGSYLYAGRPFKYRATKDFIDVLGKHKTCEMLVKRTSYCTGMILSSEELANFIHFPDNSLKHFTEIRLDIAKGFKPNQRLLRNGRPLGFNHASAIKALVRLPEEDRNKCLYMIGSSRKGKTNSIIHQIIYLAGQTSCGVGLIDPHRTAAFEILGHFPEEIYEKVIFLDFDDDNYVLDYNPFDEDDEEVFGRLSTEIVNSLKNLFDSSSFYRMNHFLGRAIYALFVLKKNLSSIPVLFSKTNDGELLRKEVVSKAKNDDIKRFWRSEYYTYQKDAFMPILNRFSSLLMDSKARDIFSREKNKINIRKIMDDGNVFIAALPSSVDVSSTTGSLVISGFQKSALARTVKPDTTWRNFHLFVDEFHRFSTGKIIESIINETVKAGLHLILANQETGQLNDELLKAVLSIPNIMVFNINFLDAKRLTTVFNGKVSTDDILSLKVGEVFARIDNDIVDFRCPEPLKNPNEKIRQMIIDRSRQLYYSPKSKLHEKKHLKPNLRELDSF